jgi:uncharacterized protein YbaR (Trm112 family)
MFIELIDLFRCPVDHEDSWLVAAFSRMDGRFVVEGKLGCPVCSGSYPIVGGVAEFAPGESEPGARHFTADDTIRFAALLGLTRPSMTIVIEGPEAACAFSLAEMSDCRVIVLNPPPDLGESERVGAVRAGERIPLAAASVDGFIATSHQGARLQEAARVLRPGGRIVAASGAAITPIFRELARDDRNVVGEAAGPLIGLSRGLPVKTAN